jgi:hypothetical protein
MPYQTRELPAKELVSGKIWQAYLDDDFDKPEQFIFSTHPAYTNSTLSPYVFDVRDLDIELSYLLVFGHPPRQTITSHDQLLSPAYQAAIQEWSDWYEVVQPRLIRKILKEYASNGS